MNGRIYDPRLGRVLSPDPVTQAPENGQNYNRYTYANNNPLRYVDLNGFEFGDPIIFYLGPNFIGSAGCIERNGPLAGCQGPQQTVGYLVNNYFVPYETLVRWSKASNVDVQVLIDRQLAQLGDNTTSDGELIENLLIIADGLDTAANALIAFDLWNSFISLGPDTAIVGAGLKGIVFGVKRAVNSNLQHAMERGVERKIFSDMKTARHTLKDLTKNIEKNGFPKGSIPDTRSANRVLVPVGDGGYAVYSVSKKGTAKLQTVLIAR